jgi:imidazolonepropionase-like amidohydrolase
MVNLRATIRCMIRAVTLTAIFAWQLAAQDVILIRGARVFDGTGAPARVADTLISGGAIDAVGPSLAAPAGARIIDGAGRTLIPGLFDLHTHLTASAVTGVPGDWGKNLKDYLAHGVTTVNDFAEYSEMFDPMRRLLASGAMPGPRVNFAARMSTTAGHGTEGGWGDFMTLEANTPEQAHARVQTALAGHPDVIKVFTDGWRYGTAPDLSSMNVETLAAIVAGAHAAGVKVFTHTVTLGGAKIAARAGVDVLAHGIGDAVVDAELIELMKAKGTIYVSTLAVYETRQAPAPPARERRWAALTANVKKLFDAGIPIASGTDAGMTGTLHGAASVHELELMVAAGLTPAQALVAATAGSARALGVDARRGTITPGKLADLVLIDGAPDRDIADIEKTSRVFLGGREFDPKALPECALPSRVVPALIDDFERPDGRTAIGTLRVNSTDSGVDHSKMLWLPIVRAGRDHSLMVTAQFAAKERPYVRLELPLTAGAVELADASAFSGVSFEVRGEGARRLLVYTAGAATRSPFAATFDASGEWRTVKIPFAALTRAGDGPPWTGSNLRALAFELCGAPGSAGWLELDNIRFY